MPHPARAWQRDHRVWLSVEIATGKAGRSATSFNPAKAQAVELGLGFATSDIVGDAPGDSQGLAIGENACFGQRHAVGQ